MLTSKKLPTKHVAPGARKLPPVGGRDCKSMGLVRESGGRIRYYEDADSGSLLLQ